MVRLRRIGGKIAKRLWGVPLSLREGIGSATWTGTTESRRGTPAVDD